MFMKTLQMMSKKDFIHQIVKSIDHYKKKKTKKVIGLTKNELGERIMTEFAGLRLKTYFYLRYYSEGDKKS